MQDGNLEAAAGVRAGEILAGKYRVEKVLGVGGMGIVVAARHLQLDTRVAIKFLLPGTTQSEEALARFAREARAAVKITSEHVARVLDVGVLDTGAPYMVMEFLEGTDLAAWLEQRGPLPIEQAVDFVLQACVAIAEAHSIGIVHRDLKPANLFCVRRADGQLCIKVLDFGISKVTLSTSSLGPSRAATRTNMAMGSPLYMSPEQMRSARDVDARTDIWALGVILHELVCGSVPFGGDSLPEVCIRIATATPEALSRVRPDVPARLEAIVLRCLQKDREARYSDVAGLALDLREFAPARGQARVDAIVGTLQTGGAFSSAALAPTSAAAPNFPRATPATAGSLPPFGRTELKAKSRTGWGLVGSGVALGIAVAAAAAFALLRPHPTAPSATPADRPHADERAAAAPGTSRSGTSRSDAPTPAAPSDGALGAPPAADANQPAASAAPPAPAPARPVAAQAPMPRAAANRRDVRASTPASAETAAPRAVAEPPPAQAPQPHPAAPRANCDPPFFFDDQGNRVFKPECVR